MADKNDDTVLNEQSERLLEQYGSGASTEKRGARAFRHWKQILPWVLAGFFGFISGVLLLRDIRRDGLSGFSTDLPSARPLIEFEQRQMKSEDDHLYVGEPSPKIDAAWRELLQGLNMNLDANEIGKFSKETYAWPQDGKFFAGVQVYHSLHCLDRLRQFMYLPYYNHTGVLPESYTTGHMDHCINYLRHTLQCNADLTPMLWYEKPLNAQHSGVLSSLATSGLALDMETMHTCRKWEPIQKWASSRQFDYRERKDLVEGGGHMRVID